MKKFVSVLLALMMVLGMLSFASAESVEEVIAQAQEMTLDELLQKAYEETKDGRKRYYTRYGAWKGTPYSDWCDSFVSFCVAYAGNESYPRESSCGRHMFLLKAAGYWREWNSYMPKAGDLVFFKSDSSKNVNHVGICISGSVMIHASSSKGQVVRSSLNQAYWERNFVCGRRP